MWTILPEVIEQRSLAGREWHLFLIKQNKKPPIIKKLLSFLVNEEIQAEREGINLLKVSCTIKNGTQNPVPVPRWALFANCYSIWLTKLWEPNTICGCEWLYRVPYTVELFLKGSYPSSSDALPSSGTAPPFIPKNCQGTLDKRFQEKGQQASPEGRNTYNRLGRGLPLKEAWLVWTVLWFATSNGSGLHHVW